MPATYIVVGSLNLPLHQVAAAHKTSQLIPLGSGLPNGASAQARNRKPCLARGVFVRMSGGSLLDQSHVREGRDCYCLGRYVSLAFISSRTFLSATCQSQLMISPARPSRYPGNLKNRTKPPAAQPRPGKGWAAGTPTKMTSSWYRGSLAH